MKKRHWTEPTSFLERFGDALELLCCGNRPDDVMMLDWINEGETDYNLQDFCAKHSLFWMQGIEVIDAAAQLSDNPVEGVKHEYRNAK